MTDAVAGYPRWRGELSRAPRMVTVAAHEVRRAWNDQWSRAAIYFALAFAVVQVVVLFSARGAHSMDLFTSFLGRVSWAALALGAMMSGPALLDDAQRGALELYFSRAVTRPQYIMGKILAVFGTVFATMFAAALIYILGTFVLIDRQPEGWAWAPLGAAGYAAIWAFVVTGAGLGLSCVSRSARTATLVLLGGFAMLDIILSSLLASVTNSNVLQVISPLQDLQMQVSWLFVGARAPYDFPAWWGLVALGIVAALGWTAVALRHPRLKGVE